MPTSVAVTPSVYWLVAVIAAFVACATVALILLDILSRRRDTDQVRELVTRLELEEGGTPYSRERLTAALANAHGSSHLLMLPAHNVIEPADDAEAMAKTLVNEGVGLTLRGRPIEAMEVFNKVLDRFSARPEGFLREPVARAQFNAAELFKEMAVWAEAVALFKVLIARFGEDRDPAIRGLVSLALFDGGIVLAKLGRLEDAIASFARFVDYVGESSDEDTREQVAWAVYNQGVLVGRLSGVQQANEFFDRALVPTRGDAFSSLLAAVMAGRVTVLVEAGLAHQAEAARREFRQRFGETPDAWVRRHTALGE